MKQYKEFLRASCLVVILALLLCTGVCAGSAKVTTLTMHSEAPVAIELQGFDGLTEQSLFKGKLPKGESSIGLRYRGLALLVFSGGQTYLVVIDESPFTLNIENPSEAPTFTGSKANTYLYAVLTGRSQETDTQADDFALLMIQAKQLLDSTQSIRTMDELAAKKKEFHDFVRDNYDRLKHSDMVRRFIAQYFMMHEYVSYHVEGEPATAIRVKYQQAVVDGVGSWIEALKPYIPEHEVLNYCASLYYQRSMVALASVLTARYGEYAFCSGEEKKAWDFPAELTLTDSTRASTQIIGAIEGKTTIAFVSDGCPVSMIQTVMEARRIAEQGNNEKLIIAPMEKLSEIHLAMNMMVSGGNMLFINDEKWRKGNLPEKVKLPVFVVVNDHVAPLTD